jgi:hypothetical protein
MHIVSKFHDFYDTASIYGIDKTCIYLRSEEEFPVEGRQWREKTSHIKNGKGRISVPEMPGQEDKENADYKFSFHKLILGFCGELYPVIKVKQECKGTGIVEQFCFYDQASIQEFLEEEGVPASKYANYSWYSTKHAVDSAKGLGTFFDPNTWTQLVDLFHIYRAPCFVISWKKLTINPCLKDLSFMKVSDPQTTFQEIYMFMSGVLGAPPPPKEKMSDKVLAAAKGHDGEYSFKKPPGKRGKKQWR